MNPSQLAARNRAMSRLDRWLLLVVCLAGCGTRTGVVKPEDVSTLNDPQWTIKSEPEGPTR